MRVLLCILLLGLISACSTTQIPSIEHSSDPEFDFSLLKTYSWLPRGADSARTDPYQELVKKALEESLEDKGYRQVAEGADFLVDSMLNVEQRVVVIEDASHLSSNLRTSSAKPLGILVEEGALAISFYEPEKQRKIFQGIARAGVNPSLSAAKREKRILKAVDLIMRGFPPE